jgi:hypothetical protein
LDLWNANKLHYITLHIHIHSKNPNFTFPHFVFSAILCAFCMVPAKCL